MQYVKTTIMPTHKHKWILPCGAKNCTKLFF